VSRGCRSVPDLVYDRVQPGGLVVAHNALGLGPSQPDSRRAIHHDHRLETTVVPAVSGGLSITTKKSPLARLSAGL
jgi:predicted O-methyltransferase YrrM